MSCSQSLTAIFVFFPLLAIANAHPCSEGFLMEAAKHNITHHCRHLQSLGAEFAWNFDNATARLDIAFGAPLQSPTAWLAWGLNPHAPRMVGTRALIGIKLPGGSLFRRQYNITAATRSRCRLSPAADLGLDVRSFSFVHLGEIDYYVILATLFLSEEYNFSSANVVWQIGGDAAEGAPVMHAASLDHLDCSQSIDLVSGEIVSFKPRERRQLRTAHGILNIIGWGIFLPVGVMVARYLKEHPTKCPWYFVFHVGCQIAGYTLGSTSWILGLWLGHKSEYYTFPTHRIIAIIIFTFTTVQVMALRLKPRVTDEYRAYWNMYHHFLGYALLALISVNIFRGIRILEREGQRSWRWSYIGVIGVLGTVALGFEIFTWIKFLRGRREALRSSSTSSQVSDVQASVKPPENDSSVSELFAQGGRHEI